MLFCRAATWGLICAAVSVALVAVPKPDTGECNEGLETGLPLEVSELDHASLLQLVFHESARLTENDTSTNVTKADNHAVGTSQPIDHQVDRIVLVARAWEASFPRWGPPSHTRSGKNDTWHHYEKLVGAWMEVKWHCWLSFVVGLVGLLVFDRWVVKRWVYPSVQPFLYLGIAAVFDWIIRISFGILRDKGASTAWITGYFYEWIFSIDNPIIFHFLLQAHKTPRAVVDKALFVTLCGQLVTRALFFVGLASFIRSIPIIHYAVGALLVYIGTMTLLTDEVELRGKLAWSISVMRLGLGSRLVDTYDEADGQFFIEVDRRRCMTPLALVVGCMIAADAFLGADCALAKIELIDSSFLNFSSSAIALFGLRSCYFLLARSFEYFPYLQTGCCWIVVFMGMQLFGMDYYQIGIYVDVVVMGIILLASLFLSLIVSRPQGCETASS